jgi:hypothetical protein
MNDQFLFERGRECDRAAGRLEVGQVSDLIIRSVIRHEWSGHRPDLLQSPGYFRDTAPERFEDAAATRRKSRKKLVGTHRSQAV